MRDAEEIRVKVCTVCVSIYVPFVKMTKFFANLARLEKNMFIPKIRKTISCL